MSNQRDVTARGINKPDWPWLALLERLQFEINCASSVAIEIPALRPYAQRLREGFYG